MTRSPFRQAQHRYLGYQPGSVIQNTSNYNFSLKIHRFSVFGILVYVNFAYVLMVFAEFFQRKDLNRSSGVAKTRPLGKLGVQDSWASRGQVESMIGPLFK
jgi:hypothetical protein